MKHFRAYFFSIVAVVILLAAGVAILIGSGLYPHAILTASALLISVAVLWNLVRKLIRTMSGFVAALEANDSTIRVEADTGDRELTTMSESMNTLASIYRKGRLELETSKLYYDRIISIMTHEMRNAITPVISLADDMKKNPAKYQEENLTVAVDIILGQSLDIKQFLDSYYQLTHLPTPEKASVDALTFFEDLKKILIIEAQNRGLDSDVVKITVAQGLDLKIDTPLMRRAIVNLVRNALDAVSDKENPSVEITVSASNGIPFISISDNGNGLPAIVVDNLFQPFITTKKGGTGIGLSLSRQIIRTHGGNLELKSTPGHGTSALISLP